MTTGACVDLSSVSTQSLVREMRRRLFPGRTVDEHCNPIVVALRNAPGAAVCIDPDCDLSGGYAHVGPCEPCGCPKNHAIHECLERLELAANEEEPSPEADVSAPSACCDTDFPFRDPCPGWEKRQLDPGLLPLHELVYHFDGLTRTTSTLGSWAYEAQLMVRYQLLRSPAYPERALLKMLQFVLDHVPKMADRRGDET